MLLSHLFVIVFCSIFISGGLIISEYYDVSAQFSSLLYLFFHVFACVKFCVWKSVNYC